MYIWGVIARMVINESRLTQNVMGSFAIAKPAGGAVCWEVNTIGRNIGFGQGQSYVVVVATVHQGIPENEKRWKQRFSGLGKWLRTHWDQTRRVMK